MVVPAPSRRRRFRPRSSRRAVAAVVTLSLLQPVVALTGVLPVAAAPVSGCYLADPDTLLVHDTAAGGTTYALGSLGVPLTALALAPDGALIGAAGTTIGTVDAASGAFTATGTAAATITGLAFDGGGALHAVLHHPAVHDQHVVIDRRSGESQSTPVDIVTASTASEIAGIAAGAGGLLVVESLASGDLLWSFDPATGVTGSPGAVVVSGTPVTGVAGLSHDPAGSLWASTSSGSSHPGALLAVGPAGAASVVIGPGGSLEGVACGTADPSTISGLVFEDADRSGTYTAGEPGAAGMAVELRRDGAVIQTTSTAGDGSYAFGIGAPGEFTVVADLPAGSGETTPAPRTVTVVGPGSSIENVDVGYRYASVAGTVFDDLDGDGVRDPGEDELRNVQVTVAYVDPAGTPVELKVKTDATGAYAVDGVPSAEVTVTVPAVVGQANPSATPEPLVFDVVAPAHHGGNDIGYDARGTVTGEVWNDLDADGVRDAGEPALGGVTVRVRDDGDPVVQTTAVVAGDGTYHVLVPPGDVTVDVDPASLPPGATTTNGPFVVTVPRAATVAAPDLGVRSLAVVGGRVFNDLDRLGTDDDGADPGFAGAPVTLLSGSDVVASTTTDGTGAFRFLQLLPGTYTLAVDRTAADDDLPSTLASTTGGDTQEVVVTAHGEISESWRFGYDGGVTIAGLIFDDLDGSGTDEPSLGEAPLAGVTISVDGATTVTTGADGRYSFTQLAHGSHQLALDPATVPAGAAVVTDLSQPVGTPAGSTVPVDVAIDASVTLTGLVFSDRDGGGGHDAGEPGIDGVPLRVTDGGTGAWTPSTTGGGVWSVPDVPRGSYTVEVTTPPAEGTLTTSNEVQTLDALTAGVHDADPVGYRSAAIGGHVYGDLDGDLTEDADETGLAGVVVTLHDDAGREVDGTLTDAAGDYRFDELAAGTYVLRFAPPVGVAPASVEVTVATSVGDLDQVAAVDLRGSIGDLVFNDLDGSGSFTAGEPGIGGVLLEALPQDGGTAGVTATTAPDGSYVLAGLKPGGYVVVADAATLPTGEGAESTPAAVRTVTVDPGQAVDTVDVGYDLGGDIVGTVWNDVDRDRTVREGVAGEVDEPVYARVGVELLDADGEVLDRTTTNDDGGYTFGDLLAGTYQVRVVAGDLPAPTAVASTGNPVTIELDATETERADVGFDAGASVTAHVWNDLDASGTGAGTEPDLSGVPVVLTHVASGHTWRVDSIGTGRADFDDLVPGTYRLDLGDLAGVGDTVPARTLNPTSIELAVGDAQVRADDPFGVVAPVALSGRVVNDLDGNGVDGNGIDEVEPGLAGVEVRLLDGNGDQVGVDTEVDPVTGAWVFDQLAPGTWTVAVDATTVPPDAPLTFGQASNTVVLEPNTAATGLDAGYAAGATIVGRVWDDLDGDRLETDESGLAGITVAAHDADGPVATDDTDEDGVFEITGLAPGTYTIVVDEDALALLGPYVRSTVQPVTVTVSATDTRDAGAIGYWRPASITVTVFDDVDGSTAQDGGESGVADRDVLLYLDTDGDGDADGPAVATARTDGAGVAVLRELGPADYVVDADVPERHIVTTGNDPVLVAIAPGDDRTVDIGVQAYAPLVTVTRGATEVLWGEAGDELRYPFRVQNDGNIGDTYALTADSTTTVRIVRADDLAAPVTSTGPLAPGEGVDLVAVVTVPAGRDRGEDIVTTLTATGSTRRLDGTVSSGRTSVTSTVAMPVIGVTIDGGEPGPGYVAPGDTVGYAVEVANGDAGDATVAEARDVVVALEIGPDTAATVVAGSIAVDGTPLATDATLPLTLPSVAAGTAVDITFEVAFARPLADGTTITVTTTATASGNPDGEGDPRSATAATTDTVSSSALPEADLTAAPPSGDVVEPGDTVVYTAIVGNRGDATDAWRQVVLVADLPDTVAVADVVVGGAAVAAGDLGAGIAVGDLAPDEYVTVTIAVTVADPVADATVLTAVFRATGENGGPVVWATSHTVEVRLGVVVEGDRTGTGAATTAVAHPHTVTNTGNVTTTFDLTATTDLGWDTTIVREVGIPNGVVDDGEEVVAGPLTIPPDQVPVHLLALVEVPAGELDGATATTTLAAFSRAEPPALDEAFAVTEAVAPDLAVDIVADPPSTVVNRGQVVTYTTTVGNHGRAEATGVVLTDPTPADATFVSGSARLDGAPVADGPGGTNPFAAGLDLGTLAAGAERTVSFSVTVGPVDDGTPLIDVASVVADDDRAAAGSVTQTVSASPVLDVVLTSTPSPGDTVTAGTAITYTAVVTNRGTLDATGVSLRQAVPDRTAYVAASTTVDGAATSDVGGTSPLVGGLSLGTLAPGGSRTVRSQVRVADPVFDGEEIVAVATATSQQGVSATSATLRSVVDVRPAVSLTGGGTQDVARPGQAVYPHVVRNDGDVTDTFTLQGVSGSGWRVSLVRDDDGNGAWDPAREITPVTATGPLAPGASVRFFAVVEVAADAALGSADTLTVTARSVVDPAVTGATTSRTRATAPSLELAMAATPSGDRVNPGSRITYVISVRNRGAAPATEVVVSSATPAGTVYVPDSATRDGVRVPDGTGADGNPLDAANDGLAIASITAGGEVLVTFAATVPADAEVGRRITADATATATATATARASRTHTVAPGPTLDLVLTATPDASTATPAGTRITYTVAVRNTGQETAGDALVVADTPRDTSYVAGSARIDGVRIPDGRTDPNPLSSVHGGLLVGDLAPDAAPRTLTYAVRVDDPVPADATVEHRVSAVAGDATATSELLVHSVAVSPAATVTPDIEAHAVPGGYADLAHTVTNTGDVTDAFALAAVSTEDWVAAIYTDRDGDGDIGPDDVEVASTPVLAPGEGTTIVVRVAVPADTAVGIQDVVRVTAASSLDPEEIGSARDTIAVVTGALRLTKTAAPLSLTPGARSTYTLTVRNVGTSPATDVVLHDAAPDGTRYVPGSTRRDGVRLPDADGTTPLAGGLAVGTLAPSAATTVTFEVDTLPDPGRSTIVNSATAAADDTATARAGTTQPVSRDHGLDLTTNPRTTVTPGATAVRPHLLSNTGVAADDVTVTATSALGLPVAIHLDRDGDGVLGGTDPRVDGPLALAAGEQLRLLAAVHYTADVPEGATDEIVLAARSGGDPRVAVTVTDVVLVSSADVSITLRAIPDGDVAVGARVAYEVTVTNRATTPADVAVTVDTPSGTTYVTGSATRERQSIADATGGDPNPLAEANGGVDLGTLSAGATVLLGFVVEVSGARSGEIVTGVAGLRIDGHEAVLSNATRTAVVDPAGLQVLKSATPTAVSGAGEVVTWTISVLNVGSGVARDVVVSDPPAAGTRYVPGSTTIDGVAAADGLVHADGLALGDLPAGGTRVVVFRTVLDVPGAVVQNVAAVRTAGSEARPLSNVAAVTVGQILPATGAAGTRTLGGAAVLLVSGWMLLYVARPERRPVPVLHALGRGRVAPTRRRRTTE